MLKVDGLHVALGGSAILRGVALEVGPRELVAVMGRNGVGKTTTLRAITGLVPPTDGSIRLGDHDFGSLSPDARSRLGVGYVPQGREIFPNLTVEENLRVGLLAHGVPTRVHGSRLDRVYGLFPVLKDMLRRKGGVLSGGQQQQLAIARALLCEPRVLLLDEPTEGIQPSIIEEIGETLKKLKRETELGILLVEQYVDFAKDIADRFYIMSRGAVVSSGSIDKLERELIERHLTV